jgi:choice-of-anchor A domain-containing protein
MICGIFKQDRTILHGIKGLAALTLSTLPLILPGSMASAQVWASPLGPAGGFNVFVFGNATMTNSQEAEGAVAVGGNFNDSGYNISTATPYATATLNYLSTTDPTRLDFSGNGVSISNIGLYVGGSLQIGNSFSVDNSADARVAAFTAGSNKFNLNGGQLYANSTANLPSGMSVSTPTSPPYAVNEAVFTYQNTYSQSQANLLDGVTMNATNSNVISPASPGNTNNFVLDASKGTLVGNTVVVYVTASQLASLQNVTLDVQNLGSYTLVVNVTDNTGATVNLNGFSLTVNGQSNFSHVLWNFGDAVVTVDVNNRVFDGSILAPKANIQQQQLIEGNIIANSITDSTNEDHFATNNAKFTGDLSDFLPDPPSTVPEPGSLTLFAGLTCTFIGGALLARRKR